MNVRKACKDLGEIVGLNPACAQVKADERREANVRDANERCNVPSRYAYTERVHILHCVAGGQASQRMQTEENERLCEGRAVNKRVLHN